MIRMLIILSIAFMILMLTSCKHDLPPFPSKTIYEIIPGREGCTAYPIVKESPLTLGDGKDLTDGECVRLESVFGFEMNDIGNVTEWIRNAQELAKKNCQ